MWRSKKLIVGVVLAAVLLAGSMGGVALAQTENGDDSQPETLMARVAEKLGINQQDLEDAFAQAKSEMQTEAMQNRLQDMIDQGVITQEEADQYQEWRQAKPDIPARFGFKGHGGFRCMGEPRGFGKLCAPAE
ncbi:hypothetical protein ACFLWY_02600 [Chloroflexota bacterium]